MFLKERTIKSLNYEPAKKWIKFEKYEHHLVQTIEALFNAWIRDERSLASIARDCELSYGCVRNIAHGETLYPSYTTMWKLADGLGFKLTLTK